MTKKHENLKKSHPIKKGKDVPAAHHALLASGGVFVLFVYLVFNIYAVESVSPLYTGVTRGEFASIIQYLQKAKKIGIYDSEIVPFAEIYGPRMEKCVQNKDSEIKAQVARLEAELKANPKARDVLYRLYLLNKQNGDLQKAQEYLNQVSAIDPEITK